jgi:hypothetical protein
MTHPPLTFTVAIHLSTHDAVKAGVLVTRTHFVTLLADTDTDATLTAILMAAGRTGGMPTGATVIDVVA